MNLVTKTLKSVAILSIAGISMFAHQSYAQDANSGFPIALKQIPVAQQLMVDLQDLSSSFQENINDGAALFSLLNYSAPSFTSESAQTYVDSFATVVEEKQLRGKAPEQAFVTLLAMIVSSDESRTFFLAQNIDLFQSEEGQTAIANMISYIEADYAVLRDIEVYATAMALKNYSEKEIIASVGGYYQMRSAVTQGVLEIKANKEAFARTGLAQAGGTPATVAAVIEVGCDVWCFPWWNCPEKPALYVCGERQTGNTIAACDIAGCSRCETSRQCVGCCSKFRGGTNPGGPGGGGNGCTEWCKDNTGY
jgi:hypothetical protein